MALGWFSVVVECEDPHRLAEFWCQALGFEIVHRTDDIVDIALGPGVFPGIEFLSVQHRSRGRGSLHLDLNPDDQAAEVDRLISLGARPIDVGQAVDADWVVLADPEGNAFCILAPQPGWDVPE
jgi:hypothetical protein